ncbi:unnamed protein product [Rotaria sp. Silwood2]|nr:unnamed protein product [Rotaria sp. Silwood2]
MSIIELLLSALATLTVTVLILKRTLLIGQFIIYLNSLTYRYKKLYLRPNRIILVRHGESQGNINESVYSRTPDAHISLTQLGKDQAIEAGKRLKEEVINGGPNESIYVYLSPYIRSKQTYEGISKSFLPSQILKVREDPRLREQEWGNLLHPDIRRTEMAERKRVGDFYFRFTNGESGADVYDRIIWDHGSTVNQNSGYFRSNLEKIFWLTESSIAPDQKNLHPAPLPQLLAKICILTTTDQGNLRMNINEILFFDVVLDPFAGSGTTLVSAAKIKQSFRSFDISKKISKYVSKTIN